MIMVMRYFLGMVYIILHVTIEINIFGQMNKLQRKPT